MSLKTKYVFLKATTIFFGALSIPWSTFTGFCFGDGRFATGLVSLALQTVVALIDGYIWFWVLENMKNRMQDEFDAGETVGVKKETCPLLGHYQKTAEYFQSLHRPALGLFHSGENLKSGGFSSQMRLDQRVEPM